VIRLGCERLRRYLSRLSLVVGVGIVFLLATGTVALAATQTYDGDLIQMTIGDTSGPSIWVKPSTAAGPSDPYVIQYYGPGNGGTSWGSVLWLNDGSSWSGYGSGYGGLAGLTGVSNTTNLVTGGAQIETVTNAGLSGVQFTQRFTYINGDRFVSKEWVITNNSATTFTGVRLYHGGDSMFGEEDSAKGFYDPAKSMVYIRNADYANWGIMGFYANPATPASHYFEGYFNDGVGYATSNTGLSDAVHGSGFVDAGYYLQWDHATLSPGQSWVIQAYEIWTPGGPLQIIAPGSQNVAPASTVSLPFTVQNLGTSSLSLTLAASTAAGWAASIAEGTSLTLPAESSVTRNVQVVVPSGATGSSTVTLSATGDETGDASTTLTVVDLDVDISPASVDFGTIVPGGSASQLVTVTNNGASPVTFGTVSTPSPFGKSADGCSGTTLANGESCTVTATFSSSTVGTHTGNLNIPVVSPALLTYTVPLAGEVVPNTAPQVDAGGDTSVAEGSTMTRSGSFTDPDDDSWTGTVDYDDGGGAQSLTLNLDKSFSLSHTYADNGSYTVSVSVDDGTVSDTDTFTVTVTNVAPTVTAATDQTVDEGSLLALTVATFTDPGVIDTHTALIDWGDGSAASVGTVTQGAGSGSVAGSHTYIDDGIYTVTVTVTDDDGGHDDDTFAVTVDNVDPAVDAGPDATITEGSTFTGSGSFTDPGGVDTYTATVDYGDGSGVQALILDADKTFALTRAYGDDGDYTVTVTVTDKDGGTESDSLVVTVDNVAPTVVFGDEGTWHLWDRNRFFVTHIGAAVVLHVSISDPGSDDLTVSFPASPAQTFFNNGTVADPALSPGGTYPVTVETAGLAHHRTPGVFHDSVVCSDDDGDRGTERVIVVVRGLEHTRLAPESWLARYSAPGAGNDPVLSGYSEVAAFFSDHLGTDTLAHGIVPLRTTADAAALLGAYEGGSVQEQVRALLLAAWLNFAAGAQEWGTLMDTDGDGHGDMAFCIVLGRAEQIICREAPSAADLDSALDLALACFDIQAEPEAPEQPEAPETVFTDVDSFAPHYQAIQGMADLGIISGFPDRTYRPSDPVTRQQFAKMITRTLGLTVTGAESCTFTDVGHGLDASDPFYPRAYVEVCAAEGITKGTTVTTFSPYRSITRQQLITMVVRAAGLPDPEPGFVPGFERAAFSLAEHYENACKAEAAGLLAGLLGVTDAGYDFAAPASRGECAQLLWSLLGMTP